MQRCAMVNQGHVYDCSCSRLVNKSFSDSPSLSVNLTNTNTKNISSSSKIIAFTAHLVTLIQCLRGSSEVQMNEMNHINYIAVHLLNDESRR